MMVPEGPTQSDPETNPCGLPCRWSFNKCRSLFSILLLLCFTAALLSAFSKRNGFRGKSWRSRCRPREVHLALTGRAGEMRVTWRVGAETCGDLVVFKEAKRVEKRLGRFLNHWSILLSGKSCTGTHMSHSSRNFCGSPANSSDYTLHFRSALLTGLKSGVKYTYVIVDGSESWDFLAPPSLPDRKKWMFVSFGNMGTYGMGPVHLMNSISKMENLQFVLANGGLANARGDELVWESYMDLIQQCAARVPWMVTAGVEEFDGLGSQWKSIDGGDCGLQVLWRFPSFRNQFPLDDMLKPAHGRDFPPFWYSFNYGVVHVVCLTSQFDLDKENPQRNWLQSDLQGRSFGHTPFTIVFFSGSYSDDHNPLMQQNIFENNGLTIDAIVTANKDKYHRGCAPFPDCRQGSLIHLELGTGGQGGTVGDWGYGQFEVSQDKIEFKFVMSVNGEVLDRFHFENRRS